MKIGLNAMPLFLLDDLLRQIWDPRDSRDLISVFFSSSFKCHFLKGNVTKERKIWKKKNVSGAIDKPHFLKGGGRGQKCQNLLSKMGREGEIKSEKLSDIVYGWPLSIFTKGCMTSWPGLVMKENRFFLLVDVKKIQGIFCQYDWHNTFKLPLGGIIMLLERYSNFCGSMSPDNLKWVISSGLMRCLNLMNSVPLTET